jgi:hypothetical protein
VKGKADLCLAPKGGQVTLEANKIEADKPVEDQWSGK